MKEKYRLEKVVSGNGEVEYRIWEMKWFGLKKLKLISRYSDLKLAEISLEEIRNNVVVKKKYIG